MVPKDAKSRPDPLAARRAALRVLLTCQSGSLSFADAFEQELQRRPLGRKDKALAHSIAAGSLKLRRRLDFIVNQYLEPRHRPLPGPICQILRLGAFQLTELSRVPRHAAVSTSVDLAKQWGHAGTARLVNAILRRVADSDQEWDWPKRKEHAVEHLGTLYSYPNWIVRHWLHELGEDAAEACCRTGNQPAGTTLRLTGTPEERAAKRDRLHAHGFTVEPAHWFDEYAFLPEAPPFEELRLLMSGEAIIQNEAAAVAMYLLRPEPGDTIVEVGAAPGGKATALAERVGEEGRIVAVDISLKRLKLLKENADRLALPWIDSVVADGRHLPIVRARKILVDAPCSALGLIHRHPELRWRKDITDIRRLAELQLSLLTAAVDAVQPGGRVVYSTCTTACEEDEGVVAALLEKRTDLRVVDPRPELPEGIPATAQWVKLRPAPPQLDGAFACCLEKTA